MKDTPAGLIQVRELIKHVPSERNRILRYEIHNREREMLQSKSLRRMMHLQAWASFQMVLAVGIVVFVLVFALGQFADLARWVQEIRGLGFSIPGLGGGRISPGSFIPTSTLVEFASRVPSLGAGEAGMITLAVIFVLVVWKGYVTYALTSQARALRLSLKDLKQEIAVLKSWLEIKTTDKTLSE